ncbi:MAG: hypothetical protein IT181_11670 [Acidobacteria bacterium]|nr:hypothetical protein [Acidobacteriota bacterium]
MMRRLSPLLAAALATIATATLATAQPYFAPAQVITAPEADRDFVGDVDVDGEWAVAGALPTSPLPVSPSVYVYRQSGGTWSMQQTLTCPDSGTACRAYGNAVGVSGTTIAIGNGGAGGTVTIPGAIWIYEWNGSAWIYTTKLTGPPGKEIGFTLAIEGNYLVTNGAIASSGAHTIESAYVFERSAGTWTRQELVGTDRVASDTFGYAVGLSGDTVCVGAPGFQTSNPGAVHMFRRGGGGTWQQEGAKLTPSATSAGRLGTTCAVDGDTAVAASPYVFVQGQPGSGRAFIYSRSATIWALQQSILPDSTTEALGQSVAVEGDGLVIGAPGSSLTPRALLFARVGATWVERGRAERPLAGSTLGDTVATDGATILIGGEKASPTRPGVLVAYVPSTTPPVTTGPPGAPTSVQASANGNTLNMTWGAPTSGAAPTNYTLIARTAAGGPVLGTAALGNVTSFSAVAPNGVFVLSLVATNASGTGPESAGVSVTLPAVPAPPSAPRTLAASVVGSTATLTWAAPASGGVVGNYVLAAGLTPGFAVPLGVLPLPATSLSYAIPGIPPGTYYLRLQAQNAGGTSAASNEVTVTVAAPSAPGAPTLNTPVVSGSTVTLSWTPGGGGAPTSYVLTALTAGGVVLGSVPVTGASLSVPNVPSGSYLLRLVAVNSLGPSPASNTVTLVVP